MSGELLGFPFEPIETGDRERLAELLRRFPQALSDYCVASLLAWAPVLGYRCAFVEADTLLVVQDDGTRQQPVLLQPVGVFPTELQAELLGRARELPAPLSIESVSEEFLGRHPKFVAHFSVTAVRGRANYVYAASDLAELRGRRYSGKRNLIGQASLRYSWTVERLTAGSAEACREVGDDIASKRSIESAVTLEQETQALSRALSLLEPLGLKGVLLRIDGRPAAFSIYDHLNPTAAVVLFERARRSEKGLYQVINQETARRIVAEGYELINREEDLGDRGLRNAKSSYYPIRLERSHTLTLRR
jgi:hypothetical protein